MPFRFDNDQPSGKLLTFPMGCCPEEGEIVETRVGEFEYEYHRVMNRFGVNWLAGTEDVWAMPVKDTP